mgnify:CR=1 FL=1
MGLIIDPFIFWMLTLLFTGLYVCLIALGIRSFSLAILFTVLYSITSVYFLWKILGDRNER